VTNVDRGDGVKHRGGIRARLRPEQDLFARIGGRETIERIVDGLYDRIEHDPSLRPMFVRNLAGEREKQDRKSVV
jgi:truncated hemoglobin YjbI